MPLAERRHAHRHLVRRPRVSTRGRRYVWVSFRPGYLITMTDDRIEQRAADLLPEERAAGSEDPAAQAAAVLAESDEREDAPEAIERRRSNETTR